MAKVPYSKLKCKTNDNVKTLNLGDGITIEVRQYLPVQEKLALIGRVVELAHEQDHNYSNPVKANVYAELEMVFAYTNLSFTEKQLEDTAKLYDQLYSSGILGMIFDHIPTEEEDIIMSGVENSIESIYKYQNSVLGILDTIKTDYSDTEFSMEKFQESLKNEDLGFLREVLTKLG